MKKTNMLEHQMKVLASLSSDPELFKKELLKSFQWLNAKERQYLKYWLKENYNHLYHKMISEPMTQLYDYAI